jgi:hypothetical protein
MKKVFMRTKKVTFSENLKYSSTPRRSAVPAKPAGILLSAGPVFIGGVTHTKSMMKLV